MFCFENSGVLTNSFFERIACHFGEKWVYVFYFSAGAGDYD